MTGQLRDALARVAEQAPVADVPADTWARARRARVRDRVLTGAAAMAVLAVVGGLTLLPPPDSAPVASGGGPGLPNHLYYVPERMSQHDEDLGWTRDEVTTDLKVGTAAAAWLTPSGGLPVVVDAAEGGYHLLDLPGFSGNNRFMTYGLHEPTIALSADGRQLAYSWATFGANAATDPIPSGVRVADLETGRVREFVLRGDEGTAVTTLAWSPDGRWLAWAGARMGSWTTSSMGRGEPVAGRVSVAASTAKAIPVRRIDTSEADLSVDDRGRVTLSDGGGLVSWDGVRARAIDLAGARLGGMAPVSPRGEVALSTFGQASVVLVDGVRSRTVDVGVQDREARVMPLAWVGDELLVVTDDNGPSDGVLRLVPVSGGASRTVGTVDGGVNPSLTVAADLVTPDRPTVERPEPDWPWSDERLALTIALVGAGALTLLVSAWRIRRRHR
ncbi:hypothetical protein ACT8ZV_02160 [Nocardioides sp. MAHUQ-72]|uniref:hypothetical protein n=1 Tax=unclassified Nocardioides TaxID=2615069 RepID=UPI0036157C1F